MDQRSHRHDPEQSIGVLIVDDHAAYRSIAVEVVHSAPGFEVAGTAANRIDALRCIRDVDTRIGLVLMDINLGEDDGVSLSEEVASKPCHPDIVLVSALSFDDLPLRAQSCGARGYIPKSQLSPSALSQVLSGVYDWS